MKEYKDVIYMTEKEERELEASLALSNFYLDYGDEILAHTKSAGIKKDLTDKLIKKNIAVWAKLIKKAPGLCTQLKKGESGLKKTYNTSKETIDKYNKWVNSDDVQNAERAITTFALAKTGLGWLIPIQKVTAALSKKSSMLFMKGLLWMIKLQIKNQTKEIPGLYKAMKEECEKVVPKKEATFQ